MSTWFSPGRIEVLGKHTDYAGGRCLVMALDRGVTASFTPGGRGIHARSTAMPDAVDVHAGPPPSGRALGTLPADRGRAA
ncbi:galactokinase family protein [Propioniciclava flava]